MSKNREGLVNSITKQILLTITLSLIFSGSVFALKINMPPSDLEAVGSGRVKNFFIINDSSTDMKAIVLSAKKRSHSITGVETSIEVEDEFKLYPEQAVIAPGQELVVTMRYIGTESISKEQAYRVIIEEVPVLLQKPKRGVAGSTRSNLSVVLKFVKSVYVTAKSQTKANMVLSESMPKRIKGKDKLVLVVHNEGGTHRTLSREVKFEVTTSAGKQAVVSVPITKITGINFLAGDKRRIVVDWPKSLRFDSSAKVALHSFN
jgi:fimbrial chaperone protein